MPFLKLGLLYKKGGRYESRFLCVACTLHGADFSEKNFKGFFFLFCVDKLRVKSVKSSLSEQVRLSLSSLLLVSQEGRKH